MRYAVFVLAGTLGVFCLYGLFGEAMAFAGAGHVEAIKGIALSVQLLLYCVPMSVALVFCYRRARATLTRNENLAVLALIVPELLMTLGLAAWLARGNR